MSTGLQKWLAYNGDNTLALDWPLNEDSHVWEIGGYEGRWAQQIWDKFHCNITIFEPQTWAVMKMEERFEGIEKIDIRSYGLWDKDTTLPIGGFFTDGASIMPTHYKEPMSEGRFKDYRTEIDNFPFQVDVALMNIEGAEYRLLDELTKTRAINKFDNIWVQFHPLDDNDTTHEILFRQIARTHFMLWNCFPTAVAWGLR